MIDTLELKNFKSIKELKIELAPLTIFVGQNGVGKSSILESIALMAQSVKGYRRLFESLKGELVDFEEPKNILSRGFEPLRLSLGFGANEDLENLVISIKKEYETFKRRRDEAPALSKYLSRLRFFKRVISQLSKRREIAIEYRHTINRAGTYRSHRYWLEKKLFIVHTNSSKEEQMHDFPSGADFRVSSGDEMTFIPPLSIHGFTSGLLEHISDLLRRRLQKVYYLSADRGFIPWVYSPPEVEVQWVGRRGEHTLGILAKLMSPEYESVRLPYELFCKEFGINSVWAGWQHPKFLTSGYRDPFLDSSHKLPSLGYGSKQLLSVIAQLAYADYGSIILVEEPEISLHPSYQRLLPALFGEAVKEGKQVVVTSHSSYFPLSLDLVLKGFELKGQTTAGRKRYRIKLSVDDIAVYHVRRGKDGYSLVEKLAIDENGLKEGIPSFIEVEKEILSRFMSKE